MKKKTKKVLIRIGIFIVIIAICMGGFMLKMKSELKNMHTVDTSQVVHNVYVIKDSFVNMFLVRDSDNFVAIDAGSDLNIIAQELKKLSINPNKVKAVFLTHTDGDHVGAIKLFKNAIVYLSTDEEPMINGQRTKMLFFHNKLDTKRYTLLDDQQIIPVGNIRLMAIKTPGHTVGSMSYLVNDSLLFLGDAFGLKDGKVDKPNKFFSHDMKVAIQSFSKIKNLPKAKYIFTAHTGYSNDYNNAIKTELK